MNKMLAGEYDTGWQKETNEISGSRK
jgi:hypothetical protein